LSGDARTICDAGTVSNYVAAGRPPVAAYPGDHPVGDQPADAETSGDGKSCFVTTAVPVAAATRSR